MSAFSKELRRSITHSLGRFIALFAITALGVGFYAGLRMTGPDMRIFLDDYYDTSSYMDVRMISTLGFDDEDLAAIAKIEGVEAVQPAYQTDVMGVLKDEQFVFRVHSFPKAGFGADGGYVNRLQLISGTWPTSVGQCVISADKVMGVEPQVGDVIEVTACSGELEDTLVTKRFTVVGFVKSPDYVSATAFGTSSLGSGSVEQYMYVVEETFAEDFPYTDLYITVAGAAVEFNDTDAYHAVVGEVLDRLKDAAPALAAARTERVKAPYYEELDEAQAKLEEGRQEYLDNKALYDDGKALFDDGKATYDAQVAQWQRGMAQYRSALAQYNERLAMFNDAQARLDQMLDAVDDNLSEEAAKELYDRTAAGVALLQAQLDEAKAQLDEAWGQLAWAKGQLDAAGITLDDTEAELVDAETQLADALAQLEEGEAQLAASRADLDNMAGAEYYVLDRTKNFGSVGYVNDTGRIDRIASVFPFIFFLVAALVALTTMTRMVDEERALIGTHKALGYSKRQIASKYLIYAGSASLVGSAVGIAVLSQVLPRVVFGAYSIVYKVPEGAYPIHWNLALLSAGLGIGIVLAATYGAVASSLKEGPAALMLPRAPKVGKRILLEHIPAIWNRLSFSWKVTCRNLFRYKKRLIMTVIGIAGCTMLLVTGWGLRDSTSDLIDKQFADIVHYNLSITTDEDMSEESLAALEEVLSNPELVSDYTQVQKLTQMVVPLQGADYMLDVIVPKSRMVFADFVEMRERETGRWVDLGASGVVMTEKLGRLVGVELGGKITLYDVDTTGNRTSTSHTMRVAGVMENYIYNYVYIAPDLYEEIWGEPPAWNMVLVKATDDEELRRVLADELRELDGVLTVAYNDETVDSYRKMLSSVDVITWVLIIAAAALAFIVLYNLTNINITERQREIATLKVLGFTKTEIYAYIYREVALLTLLGALVGLVLGIWLEGWVVVTAEVDQVMFGRDIHAMSFVISFVMTMVFSGLVMLVMRHKLDRINMVESLKSVE